MIRDYEDNLVNLEQEKAFMSEIDRLLSEIERLQSRNQVRYCEISKFTAEADTLRNASASESNKVVNLDGIGAVGEFTHQWATVNG